MAAALNRRWTPKERAFVEHYLASWNASDAARKAGYSEKGINARSYRLMQLPHVVLEINRRALAMQVRLEITADHVRQGFARIATDMRTSLEGGPTVGERLIAWRELGKLLGCYKHIFVGVGMTLEQLIAAIDNPALLEAPGAAPLRLNGGDSHVVEAGAEVEGDD